jgi:methylated-DNA-[protein]-cysteine S-methyltransferase
MVSCVSGSKDFYFKQINKHSSKFFNIFLMPIQNHIFPSPIGLLEVMASDESLISVLFISTQKNKQPEIKNPETEASNHPIILACKSQLLQYFNGRLTKFNLPLQQAGTAFQQKVWSELQLINYGRTISYLELSKRIDNVKAIRAVGTANGCNAISIIVPCHRVIGSNGDLTGYSGDLWRKKWLLDHEAKWANGVQTLF